MQQMSQKRPAPGIPAMLLVAFFVLVVLLPIQWACGEDSDSAEEESTDTDRLLIVTTVPVIYSLTTNVAGEDGRVENLLPPGASPHEFSVTPEQARLVAGADVIVMNGAGLEPWADDLVRAAGRDDLVVVTASEGISLLEPQSTLPVGDADEPDDHEGEEQDAEDEHGSFDPHVWLDVENGAVMVENIQEGLATADPEHSSAYKERGEEYRSELTDLDAEITERLADVPHRDFVAFHSAFQYYAKAYGLRQVAVIQRFPGQQPSARYLADLVDIVREMDVRAVFTEPQFSPRPAESLARETDAEVYEVDPEGSRLAADMYVELMRSNTETFIRALGDGE